MRAQRLPKKELNELASRIVKGEIYIASSGPALEHSFGHMFMLMDPLSKSQAASIGAVYEELHKALPTGINGYPFFVSCRILHVKDLDPLRKLIAKKERSLDSTSWFGRLFRRGLPSTVPVD